MAKKVPKPKIKNVLVVFINPAPVVDVGEAVPEGEPTRDTQPWFVYFASLGITLVAKDRKDLPICGYWDAGDAGAWASSMYSQIIADPELVSGLRVEGDVIPFVRDGYKMMSRQIAVPC
jgi:hypothetical protein